MPKQRKPNIVLFMTDQHRRDCIGCYGNDAIQTPNFDKMAADGVVFENAFTVNPVCMPARASLFTGRYPTSHGVKSNGMPLPETEITLPRVLRNNGYRTASVGKIHLSAYIADLSENSPESHAFWEAGKAVPSPYYGFEKVKMCNDWADWTDHYQFLNSKDRRLPELVKPENALVKPSGAPSSWKSAIPEEYHGSTWIADQSISMLEQYARGNNPFFIHISFPDPHFPYCPPAPYCDMYDPADVPLPRRTAEEATGGSAYLKIRLEKMAKMLGYPPAEMPEAYVREIIAHTYGMVTLVDKNIGRIMSKLDELSMSENTLVVFIADHGEHLGDHWLIYKSVVYDELIRVPMLWKFPGRFPKGRRLAGMASNIDLMPTILDLLEIEIPYGVQGQSFSAGLVGEAWEGRDCVIVQDDDPRTNDYNRTIRTRDFRLTRYAGLQIGELYDLRRDPNEFNCVYGDPKYRLVRDQLTLKLLDQELVNTDPLPTAEALY